MNKEIRRLFDLLRELQQIQKRIAASTKKLKKTLPKK
jgi:hypothetical protein